MVIFPLVVKDQRADGSGQGRFFPSLRCALKDFERNSKINIPSNQICKRLYSTINLNKLDRIDYLSPVNPWFLTGFSDGEASFILYIQETNNTKLK
jgi:hypothetical protein